RRRGARGGERGGVDAGGRGEGRRVHAPFVLGAVAGTRAQDDELAIAQRQRAAAEQLRAERTHAVGERGMARQRAEERERLDGGAGRHPPGERGGDVGGVGRLERGDAEGLVHDGPLRYSFCSYYKICSATKFVAQGANGDTDSRQARPRLQDRAADHGAPRSARPALGAAHRVGAARGAARLQRAAGALRRHAAVEPERAPRRAGRGRRGRRARGGACAQQRGARAGDGDGAAARVGRALVRARATVAAAELARGAKDVTVGGMTPFGQGVWLATSPVRIVGMQLVATMAVLRLGDGSLLVYSPVALTTERRAAVEALGRVAHLYAPSL